MKALFNPQNPFQVRSMGAPFQPIGYRPAPYKQVGQGLVQINPHVEAPITIELGSLPLSIGLFAGTGISFLVGAQVPSIALVTTILGVGLAGFGVINLILPKKKPGAGQPPAIAPVSPGSTSGALPKTDEDAFSSVSGEIMAPADYETIDVSPLGQPKIPARLRLSNASGVVANFDLTLDIQEQPHPFGGAVSAQQTMRMSLGAGETKDFDVIIPLSSWDALVDYVDVDVTIRKRRFSGGESALVDSVMFVVE
jgi:hypothetical protein